MTTEAEKAAATLKQPILGAAVLYRGRPWIIVSRNDVKQTADIKLPEHTGKHDTSLTLAWKDLRYCEAASG